MMSEKTLLSSKFLLFMITISMVLFIFSSLFFLQYTNTPFTSGLILKLILPSNTTNDPFPSRLNDDKHVSARGESSCEKPCSNFVSCDRNQPMLKVFMYDFPPEFHFGLMGWKKKGAQIWPNVKDLSMISSYPGGLNLQHSVEYWLTLDILASETPEIVRPPCSSIRVKNSSEADVVFVPFFSSLSYNRRSKPRGNGTTSVDRLLQDRLVEFLTGQDEWKRFGGKDHVIVAHHPNSLFYARNALGSAIFVLADFGRYPSAVANLAKDVIAPYMHVMKTVPGGESDPFEKRPILAYFQGAIYRKDGGTIRQELYYLLKDEKDVHFSFGTVKGNGINEASKGMASSKFCLNIAGDTPSSNRLFDSIVSHCVPVIISDDIELPFEDVLDYSRFSMFVHASDAVKKGYLVNLLRGITRDQWTEKWERLKQVVGYFEYRFPSRPGDAVDMIWASVSRKLSSVRFDAHRKKRYDRSETYSAERYIYN
ncbi:PREDICTED: probable arabinosyltransferase ARAD1 [Tarenaya hassleriana]|uniref:probable arabinosyltransferase ARAD1 n=1 Tax=Tarenaya hassleriana TaxID=28532 RepID=UPI00053C312F|nr:PREDICTED: probable arabinosyltransferase ARAD1 [Tarenaya hassleriana]XP_010532311.1 PREDICTED: probable arabinosyltransferase ARAD1 [Tarenaya hassleriana]